MVEAMIPGPVMTQIQAILNKDAKADRIALVWPEPIEPTESLQKISDTSLRLVYCPSELSMRERLVMHEPGGERLVMLSPFDETGLAKDVLARLWSNEPKRISPWRTLEQLLQVRQIDPRLTGKGYRWIAECLVSTYDRYKSQISFGEVLDFDKAWQALALGLLDYRESSVDLDSLLSWSLDPGVSDAVAGLSEDVKAHLGDWLEPKLRKQALLVRCLWDEGHASDMLAIGLVCSLIYRDGQEPSQEIFQARGRLKERFLGGVKIGDSILKEFGETTVSYVERRLHLPLWKRGIEGDLFNKISPNPSFSKRGTERLPSGGGLSAALMLAEQVLASLDLMPLAIQSNLLPIAFSMRLERFAKALKQSMNGRAIVPTLGALAALQDHQLARVRKDQIRRAELAVRTCAWLQTENPEHDSALSIIQDYIENGGYLDWARSRIWSGDEHEAVSQAYRQLTKRVSERREMLNQKFSQYLPAVARGDRLSDAVFPVETALDELVAPLSKQQQVLLLVLDGMNQAVYRELSDDLVRHNWVELQRNGITGPGCLVSALPSITKVSRYSLLAGSIGEGTSANEKKAFASHQALKSLASTKFPPVLFHKGDLQQIGSGALAGNVREIIAGREHRIVAAVINAVDDQLSSGAQLAVNWSVESVSVLRQILEAARESGRIVIFTSDHGHVLDHDMHYTKTSSDAERYKQSTEEARTGEIMVEGERVVQPIHKVILPWSEKIRYTPKKMGYHGGGSLQEVIIPFGVFRNAGEVDHIDGWREVPHQEPSWWHLETVRAEVVLKPQVKVTKTSKKDKYTLDLFAQPESPTSKSSADEDWIACLFASPVYAQMKSRVGRVIIGEDQLESLLRLLVERGGQQMMGVLVQALGIPAIRLNGFLAGVQKLLNVDGYPVLSIDRTTKTVKLNIESLKTQFEL